MIELRNFSKVYNSKSDFAVKDVSLVIPEGTITGLIGPNGSGKTTVMKALCGFHYPTAGEIIKDGDVGYVPEIPMLPPELTVKSFLIYAAETHGLEKSEIPAAVERVISECSLEKFISKKIKTLSKGQKQRVSFAQAIINDPKNLILDEPASGLDPAQIIQMRALIQKLSKTKAVLMSTHILQEVYSLCTNLYIMSGGKVMVSGTEAEIIKTAGTKNLEEAFIKLTCGNEDGE